MTKKKELKELINSYCREKGISKADFAVKAGVSGATLSSIEKGHLERISEAMASRLMAVVNGEQVKSIFKTRDFLAVQRLCELSREFHFMLGLVGDTGTGKSTSLKYFAQGNKDVYRVTLTKALTQRVFLDTLMKELGLDYYGTLADRVGKIIDYLNSRQNALLIIDEAGKMTQNVMLLLHDIREGSQYNCGIVLGGMPYFKAELEKSAKRQKTGYAEFYRRVNMWQEMDGLNQMEIEAVAKSKGVEDGELEELSGLRRFADLENRIILNNALKGGF